MLIEMIEAINKEISSQHPIQKSGIDECFYDFESFTEDCEYKEVWEGNIDKHRWYELQDTVFKLTYRDECVFVKNTLISQIYSESSSFEDIFHSYSPFKIVQPKEITTIIYE